MQAQAALGSRSSPGPPTHRRRTLAGVNSQGKGVGSAQKRDYSQHLTSSDTEETQTEGEAGRPQSLRGLRCGSPTPHCPIARPPSLHPRIHSQPSRRPTVHGAAQPLQAPAGQGLLSFLVLPVRAHWVQTV